MDIKTELLMRKVNYGVLWAAVSRFRAHRLYYHVLAVLMAIVGFCVVLMLLPLIVRLVVIYVK